MPTVNNSAIGLLILSIGILGVIISFLITDRKKYFMALGLSGLIAIMGLFQFFRPGVRQWKQSRRMSDLRKKQKLNLKALQEKLRQARSEAGKKAQPKAAQKKK